jgi:hypothetical protein
MRGALGLPYVLRKSIGCGTGVRSRLPRPSTLGWDDDGPAPEVGAPGCEKDTPRRPLPPDLGSIGKGSSKIRMCKKRPRGANLIERARIWVFPRTQRRQHPPPIRTFGRPLTFFLEFGGGRMECMGSTYAAEEKPYHVKVIATIKSLVARDKPHAMPKGMEKRCIELGTRVYHSGRVIGNRWPRPANPRCAVSYGLLHLCGASACRRNSN